MKESTFVNPEQIETLEHYGASLVTSMISLRTLEAFHIATYKKGIMDEDMAETSKTICWELRRLMKLYKTQLEQVQEKAPLDETSVLESLKQLITMKDPDVTTKPN
jgi:hypothetical protein